jgi:DNA-binding XRE family transcriptional regulator
MPATTAAHSPLGSDATDRARLDEDPAFTEAAAELASLENLARVFIAYRIEHGLTQEELAQAMGTSASAISRLESGQHQPNLDTLRKFATVTGRNLLVGFEDKTGHRELVAV